MITNKVIPLSYRYPGELTINGKRYFGRVFRYEGRTIEVYKIRVLAAAMGKTTGAILKWEQKKLFPDPLYGVQGDRMNFCRRWYSREQIVNLNQVANLIPYDRGNGHRHLRNQFFSTIKKLFAKESIVTLQKTTGASHAKGTEGTDSARIRTGRTTAPAKPTGYVGADRGAGTSDEPTDRPVRKAAKNAGTGPAKRAKEYNPSIS